MSRRIQQYPKLISFSLIIGMAGVGCASPTKPSFKSFANDGSPSEHFLTMEEKVLELEVRLNALNEKLDLLSAEHPEPETKVEAKVEVKPEAEKKLPEKKVDTPPATKNSAIPKPFKPASKFAESFQQDEATDRYREAKILYDTKKYSDSILEFSEFIKDNPRHIFASNAQYFIGMSYLQQKEYTIAEEELNRVLINYPHSNAIPDTLLALVQVSENLKKSSRVTYYREKLTGHFPNSPQAKQLAMEKMEADPVPVTSETTQTRVDEQKISIEKPITPQVNVNDAQGLEPSVVKQ